MSSPEEANYSKAIGKGTKSSCDFDPNSAQYRNFCSSVHSLTAIKYVAMVQMVIAVYLLCECVWKHPPLMQALLTLPPIAANIALLGGAFYEQRILFIPFIFCEALSLCMFVSTLAGLLLAMVYGNDWWINTILEFTRPWKAQTTRSEVGEAVELFLSAVLSFWILCIAFRAYSYIKDRDAAYFSYTIPVACVRRETANGETTKLIDH